MIPDPSARTVLCYGDSNTHGAPADTSGAGRLAPDVRWTGRLQRLLGNGFAVIEEGLSGRTTDLDDPNGPFRNGRESFGVALLTHNPLDVVVIMLGTNDLKTMFARSARDIARALDGYLDDIAAYAGTPATILVSPILVDDTTPLYAEWTSEEFGPDSVAKSRELAGEIRRVAEVRGAHFVDAAAVARPGADGLHLDVESQDTLARELADAIAKVSLPPRG